MAQMGADVAQLEDLARTFDGAVDDLIGARTRTTAAIGAVAWYGPDAEGFRRDWTHHHAPTLGRLATTLTEIGREVRNQADEQRAASAGGGTDPGHPAPVRSTPDPADLDGDGRVDDLEREWADRRADGERIGPPQLHLDENGAVPQGLGFDQEQGQILTTYYDPDGVRLSIQDQHTGVEIGDVRLGGDPDQPDLDPPNKGGGVATDGEFVWLADGGEVFVYRRSDIDAAAPGTTVPAIDVVQTEAASWVTYHDGRVYVGDFKNPDYLFSYLGDPKMYSYAIGGDGGLSQVGEGQDIPYSVQGATVTDDGVLFSRSFSDQPVVSPHDLTFQEFEGPREDFQLEPADQATKVFDLPHFSEGVVQVGDEAWVLSEGGADKFGGDGEQWIQVVPMSDLGDLEADDGTGPSIDLPDLPGIDTPDLPPIDPPGPGRLPGVPIPDVPSIPLPDVPVPLPEDLPDIVTSIPGGVERVQELAGTADDVAGVAADELGERAEDLGGGIKDGLEDVGGFITGGLGGLG